MNAWCQACRHCRKRATAHHGTICAVAVYDIVFIGARVALHRARLGTTRTNVLSLCHVACTRACCRRSTRACRRRSTQACCIVQSFTYRYKHCAYILPCKPAPSVKHCLDDHECTTQRMAEPLECHVLGTCQYLMSPGV